MRLLRCLLLACCAVLAASAADVPTLAIGSKAPDFTLIGVDDKQHALAEYQASKVLVIIFTCNHCPTAQAYETRIQALADAYRDKGVALVAINPNSNKGLRLDELGYTDVADSFAEMKLRAADHKFTYPYLDDGETQATAKAYGPRVTPHAFVFDAERTLRYEGRIDDSERIALVKTHDLQTAIDALLAGQPVAVEHTKTAGCSTKWMGKESAVADYNAKVAAEPVTLEAADEAALKSLKANATDKLLLVNCWNTTCGPCIAELPEFVTINRMYRKRDFQLVTLSTDFPDQKAAALKVLTANQVAMRNLIFADPDTYKMMAAFDPDWQGETPYTLLIAPGGKVLLRITSAIDPLALKRAIVNELGRVYGPKP